MAIRRIRGAICVQTGRKKAPSNATHELLNPRGGSIAGGEGVAIANERLPVPRKRRELVIAASRRANEASISDTRPLREKKLPLFLRGDAMAIEDHSFPRRKRSVSSRSA